MTRSSRHLTSMTFCILSLSGPLSGQEQALRQGPALTWSGEVRIRSEADGRDFRSATPFNLYTLSRVRLGVLVDLSDGVSVFVQAQDSRTFGEERDEKGAFSTTASQKNLDLHQAYLSVNKFLDDAFSFKLGRMELLYGNERIISPSGWNNVSRSFDGLVARYALRDGFIDGFVLNTGESNTIPSALTAAKARYVRDTGQVALGSYASMKWLEGAISSDLYAIYQYDGRMTDGRTADLRRTTAGALIKGRQGAWFGDAEFSWQTGRRYDPFTLRPDVPIRTHLFAVAAGYAPDGSWLSSVSCHADLLSGRSAGESDARSYEPVFPSSHKFFGSLDYFTSFPTQTYDRGMIDLYLRFVARPAEGLTASAGVHQFTLQHPATIGAVTSSALGKSLNVVLTWKYSPRLTFETGFGGLAPGAVMRASYGGADVGTHAYLTTQVNF